MFEYYAEFISVWQAADRYSLLATLKHPKNCKFHQLTCTNQEGKLFLLSFNERYAELEVFLVSTDWSLTEAWVLKIDRENHSFARRNRSSQINICFDIVVSNRGRIFLKLKKSILEICFWDHIVVRIYKKKKVLQCV